MDNIVYLIGVLIWSFVWGFVTKKVNENKGYDGGFWWGFFLGFIGLIIVLTKPQNTNNYPVSERSEYDEHLSSLADEEENFRLGSLERKLESDNRKRILSSGGWQCWGCQRTNADYVTTCLCGVKKGEKPPSATAVSVPKPAPSAQPKPTIQATANPVLTEEQQIEKYKKMWEDGLITEEDFTTKKKQILGI